MSIGGLVAYESSDESGDEVNSAEDTQKLPGPVEKSEDTHSNVTGRSLLFNSLPKPRAAPDNSGINEAPVTTKREKGPVKISIPSLSEFQDVDEEIQQRRMKIQPSATGTGLFSVLPPPSTSLRSATSLVPHAVKKLQEKPTLTEPQAKKPGKLLKNHTTSDVKPSTALNAIKYDSNSEDEDEEKTLTDQRSLDFFSLSKSVNIQIPDDAMAVHMLPAPVEQRDRREIHEMDVQDAKNISGNQILTSTVMNLPRDEIILKNQTEVGPKLPVPEQEYHMDADGNVAFDEKAIEYLCGKRGVKRKNELIQEANIIDINGEDIKPDEREWLVKALTEEQVQRPVSLSAGPSGASKKKHQITYLAHQAKAMELELQNQWASNRMLRKQTKSKYGF